MGLRAAAAVFLLVIPLTSILGVGLEKVQRIAKSSAFDDFAGSQSAYTAASNWHTERLLQDATEGSRAPYLACADYEEGRHALMSLENVFSASAIHRVSNTEVDGSCFIVTASPSAATHIISAPETFALLSVGPLLPSVKLATGLLDHGPDVSDRSSRLRSAYGDGMTLDNVRGLSVRLSPGSLLLAGGESSAGAFIRDWHADLMSTRATMQKTSFWSDPGEHRKLQDTTRVREWSRAAAVVDGLASTHGRSAGEVCKLGDLRMRHIGDDLVLVEGMDHLLPSESPPSETKMACYMGLLSKLAAKPEVLRVSPTHSSKLMNSVANAIVQSATTTETPLLDAGLDGTGEVIQVVDSGLDETSCFFADDDGLQVEHGHLYDGVRMGPDGNVSLVYGNYSFAYDLSRRKVVQYIEMFKKPDEDNDGADGTTDEKASFTYYSDYLGDPYDYDGSEYVSYYDDTTWYSSVTWSEDSSCAGFIDDISYHFSFLFEDTSYTSTTTTTSTPSFTGGFYKDIIAGHGTFTAANAAGAISAQSSIKEECYGDELPGCAGGCIMASDVDAIIDNGLFDLDAFCPMYDCDGNAEAASYSYCLSDDPVQTLREHGGVAPGAQISMFDASYTGYDIYVELGGNLIWYSAMETGARIHSNSWATTTQCEFTELEYLYDTFMYENPEHLLVFSAANDGGFKDIPSRESCTIGSPAKSKNILAVGATSGGPSRATQTGTDGRLIYESVGITDYSSDGYPWICVFPSLGAPSSSSEQADIDTIAWFSSYGPTPDGRIKPDVVAPGDQVFSASSDGTDGHSCKLGAGGGTSASCPLVAGSAALVRQYFKDPAFFANDVMSRGGCDPEHPPSSKCSAFTPSAATVKAMIINSANLMGGSSEPDNFRGFGRVHLEPGLPLDGVDETGLLVVDSSEATISSFGENTEVVMVNADAGVELRATLCWLDPPTTALSATQLLHDLDLVVTAPSGATYTMWASGVVDTVNVIERVIVPASSMESGAWSVIVSAKGLLTDEQSYSLVVTGAIYN